MAYTVISSYDSKTPGKRRGPFRSIKAAERSIKCARRAPRSRFRRGPGHWEINCGDTVVADVWQHRQSDPP